MGHGQAPIRRATPPDYNEEAEESKSECAEPESAEPECRGPQPAVNIKNKY